MSLSVLALKAESPIEGLEDKELLTTRPTTEPLFFRCRSLEFDPQ